MNGVRHHTWFSSALSSCYMVFARILKLEWLLSNSEIEFLYLTKLFWKAQQRLLYFLLLWWLEKFALMTWLYYNNEVWGILCFLSPKGQTKNSNSFFQFIGQTFGELSKCGFVSGASSAWQFRRSLEISMFRHFSGLPICSFRRMWLSRTQENYGQTSNRM